MFRQRVLELILELTKDFVYYYFPREDSGIVEEVDIAQDRT